ncbi:MAG TPA: hypothetical protein VGP24_16545 [Glaciihabitans sp.]|jgi:hypothetical protein|nr:hypothetical protein [Glaciihabitans sp.]
MLRTVAQVLGVVVALLAVIGFFIEGELLAGLMNVDIALDVLRLVLAAALLYVGFARVSASAIRLVIILVGVMYVLLGLLAFADRTIFGLLPTGLTNFDIGFHLIVGAGALIVAFIPGTKSPSNTTSPRHNGL